MSINNAWNDVYNYEMRVICYYYYEKVLPSKHVKSDILEAAGNLHLCEGQEAGCEAVVHAMHSLFSSSTTQAVLFADASNVFNSLNQSVSLHNLHYICPLLLSPLPNL